MDQGIHHRTRDEVQRGVETALRTSADNGTNSNEPSALIGGEKIEMIGNMSARAILEASETAARDIKAAGQAAVDVATEIMKEAEQLATDLRGNGEKIGAHLREFAALAKRVSTAMRDTRSNVRSSPEHPLPLASLLPRHEGAPSGVY